MATSWGGEGPEDINYHDYIIGISSDQNVENVKKENSNIIWYAVCDFLTSFLHILWEKNEIADKLLLKI